MLTEKGVKIKRNLIKFYGQVKGEMVFQAMIKEGKLHGVETKTKKKKKRIIRRRRA